MAVLSSTNVQSNRSTLRIYHDDGSYKTITREECIYIDEDVPFDESGICVDIDFEISKAKPDEQLVSGWASVSVNADGSIPLDWQDDIIRPEVLEKAAVDFMQEYRESGVMHEGGPVGTVVESIVFTKEKQEILGIPEGTVPIGWFVTIKVHDSEVFAKVKNGTFKMFSIQGTCKRVKL